MGVGPNGLVTVPCRCFRLFANGWSDLEISTILEPRTGTILPALTPHAPRRPSPLQLLSKFCIRFRYTNSFSNGFQFKKIQMYPFVRGILKF